jgi:ABC-type dipeptide/oligopeptide/nickel transport system permease subunit
MLTSKFMNLEGGAMKVKFWNRRRVWTMWLAMGVSLVVAGAAQAMAVDPGSGKSYGPTSTSTPSSAIRPDDRAVRVVPSAQATPVIVDNSILRRHRAAGLLPDVSASAAIRPDDRAVRVVPPASSTPVLVATDSKGGFDWSDATYGLLVGFMLALLAAGIAVATRSRGRLAHS